MRVRRVALEFAAESNQCDSAAAILFFPAAEIVSLHNVKPVATGCDAFPLFAHRAFCASDPSTQNCITEEVSEPTDEDVQKLFIAVWPKLRRTLRSRQSVLIFVDLLTSHFKSSEPTVPEIPAVMPAAATFDLPSSDGDSLVEPEFYDALPPETDRATICAL